MGTTTTAQQQTVADEATGWSQNLPFTQFNPSQGTLDGIGVSLSGDVVGTATEENNIAEIMSDQGRFPEARKLLESARATWASAGYRVGAALATGGLDKLAGWARLAREVR